MSTGHEFDKLNKFLSGPGIQVTVRRASQHIGMGPAAYTLDCFIKLKDGLAFGSCILRFNGDLMMQKGLPAPTALEDEMPKIAESAEGKPLVIIYGEPDKPTGGDEP